MRNFKNIFSFLLLPVFLAIGMTAPDAATLPVTCTPNSNVNRFFDQRFIHFLTLWHIPGGSVAIMQNNKLVFSCAYGFADLETKQPVTPQALFRIGSVSKTITALEILQLAQENKLHLDDKVFALLDDLTPLHHEPPNPQIYKITIRNLLQMSSGWYTDRIQDPDPLFGPWSQKMLTQLNGQTPPDCLTAARMMMTIPLQFTPGKHYSYSNLNYCLLGLIINKVTRQPNAVGYESYIQQNLLAPNGITTMRLGSTMLKNRLPNEVKYYYPSAQEPIIHQSMRLADGLPYGVTEILLKNYADGGWIASAVDLVKLLQAFHYHRILNTNMVAIMTAKPLFSKKQVGYSAMGWDKVALQSGRKVFTKTGSFTGTQAFIMHNTHGISYAALFNTKPSDRKQFIAELKLLLATLKVDS
jgi:N-acyl-D-amino-acid deacylase